MLDRYDIAFLVLRVLWRRVSINRRFDGDKKWGWKDCNNNCEVRKYELIRTRKIKLREWQVAISYYLSRIDVSRLPFPPIRSFVQFFLSLDREGSLARPKETRIFEETTGTKNIRKLRPLFSTRKCYIANRERRNGLFAFCLRVATFIEADTYEASTCIYNANGAHDRFGTERRRHLEINRYARIFLPPRFFVPSYRSCPFVSVNVRLGRDQRLNDFLLRRRA